MKQDEILTQAIQLIKSGDKGSARSILEPYLVDNPHHIDAWMWEVELFSSDRDKLKILQACLRHNPDHPKVLYALNFFKKRTELNPPTSPFSHEPGPAVPLKQPEWIDPQPVPQPLRLTPPAPAVSVATPAPAPQRPRPAAPKKARTMQRPAWLTTNLIFTLLGSFVLLVLIGMYLGWGFSLDGQINQAFALGDCQGVVEQTSFASLYPRALFGSVFKGYRQYSECRMNLDISQLITIKNWSEAYPLAQQYLETYPDGAFAGSLKEEAPVLLDNWSNELFSRLDYATGIEKQKQIVTEYPQSPAAQSAPDLILRSYLAWTEQLTGAQKYKDAEQALNGAASYFQKDSARARQVTQTQVKLYLAWGDWLVQQGDVTGAVMDYQKAAEISAGGVDVNLLIARANLQKALSMSKAKNFNAALTKVQEISDLAQSENIKTEAATVREQILAEYAVSDSLQAQEQIAAAIILACQGKRPELSIFGLDAGTIRFASVNPFAKLPDDQIAATPGELRYVICIKETEVQVQTCQYTKDHHLTRMLYSWQVTLYDMLDGTDSNKTVIKGSTPKSCPSVANFMIGSPGSKLYGNRPTIDQITEWLGKLDIAR